jgi:hypothetical protein
VADNLDNKIDIIDNKIDIIDNKIDIIDNKVADNLDNKIDNKVDKVSDTAIEEIRRYYKFEQLMDTKSNDVEHKLLWDLHYKTTTAPTNAKELQQTIKKLLNDVADSDGQQNKEFASAELFDYMATEGYKMMYHEKFKTVVQDKIIELCLQSGVWTDYLKPSTKQFIYACTGMKL